MQPPATAPMPAAEDTSGKQTDASACQTVINPADIARFNEAIVLFNSQQFHACHDVLEELWLAETRPCRDIYKGILQVGVAFWHEGNGNRKGALRLLARGLHHLASFGVHWAGVDLAALRRDATAALHWLAQAQPTDTLPHDHIPRLHAVSGGTR